MKVILFAFLFISHIYPVPIYSQNLITNQFKHNYPSLNAELKRNFNFMSFDDHLVLPWSQDEFIQFTFEGLELTDVLTGETALMPIPQFVGSFESALQFGFIGNSQSINLKKNINQKNLTGFIEYGFDGFQPSGKTILGTDGISLGYRNFTAMVSGQIPVIENSQFAVAGRQIRSSSFWKNDEPIGETFGGLNYNSVDFGNYDRESEKLENFTSSLTYPKYRKNALFDQKDIDISLVLPYQQFEFSYLGLFNQMKGNEGVLPLEIFNPDHQMQRNKTTYANQFGLKINVNENNQLNFKFSCFNNFVEQNDPTWGSDIKSALSPETNPYYYKTNYGLDVKTNGYYAENLYVIKFDPAGKSFFDYYKTEQKRIRFDLNYALKLNENNTISFSGYYKEFQLRKLKYWLGSIVQNSRPNSDDITLSESSAIDQYGYDFLGNKIDSKYFPVKKPNEWRVGSEYEFITDEMEMHFGLNYKKIEMKSLDINHIERNSQRQITDNSFDSVPSKGYILPEIMLTFKPNKYFSSSFSYKKQAYSPDYDKVFTGYGKRIREIGGLLDDNNYLGTIPTESTLINICSQMNFYENHIIEVAYYQNERVNSLTDLYKEIIDFDPLYGVLGINYKGSSNETLLDHGFQLNHSYRKESLFLKTQFVINKGNNSPKTKSYQFSEILNYMTDENLRFGFDHLTFSLNYYFTKEEPTYYKVYLIYQSTISGNHIFTYPEYGFFERYNNNGTAIRYFPQRKEYQNLDFRISKIVPQINLEVFILCRNLLNDVKLYEAENFYVGEFNPTEYRVLINNRIKENNGQKALDIYKDIKENNRPELYQQPRNIIIGLNYVF